MLIKLLKYDFKRMFSSLFPYYLLMMGLGLVTTLFNKITEYFEILNFMNGMLVLAFIIITFASFFYTFFVSIRKYYKNILKNEGYLTNTLPVSKNKIVLSKLITSIIFIIINTICVFIAIGLTPINLSDILDTLEQIFESGGIDAIKVLSMFIISMFLSYLTYLLIFYAALALGHTRSDKKILYSLIFGICLYMISQMISSIIIVIIGVVNPNIIYDINSFDTMDIFMIIGYILSFIYIIIYYIITIKVLDKNLNLD